MTLLIQNNNSFIVIGVFLVDAVVKWSNCWTRWVGTDISQGVETYVRDVTSVCPSYMASTVRELKHPTQGN